MKLETLAASMLLGLLIWIGIIYYLVPVITNLVNTFKGVVG